MKQFPITRPFPPHALASPVAADGGGGNRHRRIFRSVLRGLHTGEPVRSASLNSSRGMHFEGSRHPPEQGAKSRRFALLTPSPFVSVRGAAARTCGPLRISHRGQLVGAWSANRGLSLLGEKKRQKPIGTCIHPVGPGGEESVPWRSPLDHHDVAKVALNCTLPDFVERRSPIPKRGGDS